MLRTNKGTISMSDQTAKGNATAYNAMKLHLQYLEESFATEMDVQHLREGGNDEYIRTSIKNMHREKFGFKAVARPEMIAYLFAWLLGADNKTGSSDPYTHELTRASDGRKYLTLFRKLDTAKVQKLYDAKIEALTLEGEAGKPINVTIEGQACNSSLVSTEPSATYEGGLPFVFYHGNGAFSIDSAVQANIKKWMLKVTIKSQEGLQSDGLGIEDLPDLQADIEFSAELFADDINFWKKMNYYNTSSPNEGVYKGAISLDMNFHDQDSGNDRELKIVIPEVAFSAVTGINLKGEPAVMTQTVAGIARYNGSDAIITVTVKNSVSDDLA